jgi:hypothetical protein
MLVLHGNPASRAWLNHFELYNHELRVVVVLLRTRTLSATPPRTTVASTTGS